MSVANIELFFKKIQTASKLNREKREREVTSYR